MNTYNSFSELAASPEAGLLQDVTVFNFPKLTVPAHKMKDTLYAFSLEQCQNQVQVMATAIKDAQGNPSHAEPFYVQGALFDNAQKASEGMTRMQQGTSWDTGKIITFQ